MARPRTTPKKSTPQAALAARLVQARSMAGLSQAECARGISISRPRYAAFEEGRNPIRWDIALRFCRQLIVSEFWLATGQGDMREYHDIIFSPFTASVPPDASFLDAFASTLSGAYLSPYGTLPVSMIRFRADGSDSPELYGRLFSAIIEQWKKNMPEGCEVPAMASLLQCLGQVEERYHKASPMGFMKRIEGDGPAKVAVAQFEINSKKDSLTYSGDADIQSGRYEHTTPVNMQKKHISSRIKNARKSLGLSQLEAAKKWGFPVQTIQQWEHGRREPRALYAEKIESILAEIESNRQPLPGTK